MRGGVDGLMLDSAYGGQVIRTYTAKPATKRHKDTKAQRKIVNWLIS